ncbi:hypothetical protein RCL1_000184 [Eukaryota sp. TZLM3-RCL]
MQLSDLCIQSSLKETPSSASFLSFYNDIFYVHHIFNKTRFSPSDTSFLLDSFNSPYLFPYSHIFQDEYRYHLIREYSEFATLSSLLEPPFSSFSLSIDEIWKVSMEILLALNTLHKHSIIHGNLCLGNLLFNSSSRPIGVRIADYGLFHFRHVQDKHQSNGDFDPFKSPELYSKNHDFSYSSDYFSFGVVLYFLVFHSFPFNSKEELLNKSVSFSQESPFNKIISGLLERDPLLRLSYIKLLQIPEVVVAFKTVHGFIPLGAKVEPKILPQSTENHGTFSPKLQLVTDPQHTDSTPSLSGEPSTNVGVSSEVVEEMQANFTQLEIRVGEKLQSLTASFEILSKDKLAIEQQITALNDQQDKASTHSSQLEGNLSCVGGKVENLTQNIQDLALKFNTFSESVDKSVNEIKAKRQVKVEKLTTQVNKMEAVLEAEKTKISQFAGTIEAHSSALSALRTELTLPFEELTQTQKQVNALESLFKTIVASNNERHGEHKDSLSQMRSENTLLRSQLDDLRAVFRGLKKNEEDNATQMNARISRVETSLNNQRNVDQFNVLRNENEELKKRMFALEERIKQQGETRNNSTDLVNEVASIRKDRSNQNMAIERLASQLSSVANLVNGEVSKSEHFAKEIGRLKHNLSEAHKMLTGLVNERSSNHKEFAGIKAVVDSLSATLQELQSRPSRGVSVTSDPTVLVEPIRSSIESKRVRFDPETKGSNLTLVDNFTVKKTNGFFDWRNSTVGVIYPSGNCSLVFTLADTRPSGQFTTFIGFKPLKGWHFESRSSLLGLKVEENHTYWFEPNSRAVSVTSAITRNGSIQFDISGSSVVVSVPFTGWSKKFDVPSNFYLCVMSYHENETWRIGEAPPR